MTILASLLAVLGIGVHAAPPLGAEVRPAFNKVMVIVLENADYADALQQPFLSTLAKRGAVLTNYHGISHPSQPNYIAMIAGDTMGVWSDFPVDVTGRHLGSLLDDHGLSWGVYAEGYPSDQGCFLGRSTGRFVRKHVPFLSFTDVQRNADECGKVKEASSLDADVAAGRLPDVSFYVPDMDDDGHDTDVSAADKWLSGFLGPKMADPKFMAGMLIVVTFDESENFSDADNHILTILLGDPVAPGSSSDARYDHVSLLRTIEDGFGLGDLGRGDASAAAFAGIWKSAAPVRTPGSL